jgi:hypothetical protein
MATPRLEFKADNSCNNWICCCCGWLGKKPKEGSEREIRVTTADTRVERKPSPVSQTFVETTEFTAKMTHVVQTHMPKRK